MAILGVQQSQHRRPLQYPVRPTRSRLVEMRGFLQHLLRRNDKFGARGHCIDLRAAGELQLVHGVECLLNGGAAGQKTVQRTSPPTFCSRAE